MTGGARPTGIGIGWRPELAPFIAELAADPGEPLSFVEVIAENVDPGAPPHQLEALRERGLAVIPHGISLSLAGAEQPERPRLRRLAQLATRLESPLVSEHIAFVRAAGIEAGHLLPPWRTRTALEVLVHNVREAQAALPVPLALEHVAAPLDWPFAELGETEFLSLLLEATDALLLLDLANLYANATNHGFDATAWLGRIPLDRIAYVHVGGGTVRDGIYHDTHTHPVVSGVLDLVEDLCHRTGPPGLLLERDDRFPPTAEMRAELASIRTAAERGAGRTTAAVAGRA